MNMHKLLLGDRVIITEFGPLSSMAEYTGHTDRIASIRKRSGMSDDVLVVFDDGTEAHIGSSHVKKLEE